MGMIGFDEGMTHIEIGLSCNTSLNCCKPIRAKNVVKASDALAAVFGGRALAPAYA